MTKIWHIWIENKVSHDIDSNLFVLKYELYLPDKEELQKLVDNILERR